MKISEILQLDCRIKDNARELRDALARLPFFEATKFFDTSDIEDALWKMSNKYPISLGYIMPGKAEEQYYSFMIKRTDTNDWIKTIYACSMFEGLGKAVIFIYGYIQNVLKKEG